MNDQNRLRRLSVILFFLMLIMLVAHMESLVRFNRREVQIQGGDSVGGVKMEIAGQQARVQGAHEL